MVESKANVDVIRSRWNRECFLVREQLNDLDRGRREVLAKFAELRGKYFSRSYQNARAQEYAMRGFGRRLGTLV